MQTKKGKIGRKYKEWRKKDPHKLLWKSNIENPGPSIGTGCRKLVQTKGRPINQDVPRKECISISNIITPEVSPKESGSGCNVFKPSDCIIKSVKALNWMSKDIFLMLLILVYICLCACII